MPLLKDGDSADVVKRWVEVAGALSDEEMRADVGGIARVFAKLSERQGAWHPALEGWMMERSEFLMERDERARTRANRENLIDILQVRLGVAVPMDVLKRIQAEDSVEHLRTWMRRAAFMTDVAEVRTLLGPPE